jgi:hypothetical protein
MKPYVLGREEGQAIWMFDALDTIKADAERTGGGFSAVEFLDFEGSSVPLHVTRPDRPFSFHARGSASPAGGWALDPRRRRSTSPPTTVAS